MMLDKISVLSRRDFLRRPTHGFGAVAITTLLATSFIASIGCHQSSATDSSRPSLGFHVAWPGEPKEHLDDIAKRPWTYFAIYRDEDRHLIYSLGVSELGPAAANTGPQKLLSSARQGESGQEFWRADSEYGPAKDPAIEVYWKVSARLPDRTGSLAVKSDCVERFFVVVRGTRTYDVSVIGSDKAAVETLEVDAFLHSLVIEQ